jgi:hypothetical protein
MNLLPLSLECRRTRKLHAALQKVSPLCRARLMIKVAIVVVLWPRSSTVHSYRDFPLEKQLRL